MKTLKLTLSLVLFAALTATLTSCWDMEDPKPGREIERDYDITGFDRLDLGDGFNLVVEQGDEYKVHVRGDERNVDDLIIDQDGTELKFQYRFGSRRRHRYTTYITITMPSLKAADLSGAVDARIAAFVEDEFSMSISGACDVELNLTANVVEFDLTGASDLVVTGSASDMDLSLAGASTFHGLDFEVTRADVDASGASDIRINATESLRASASGASNVIYRGNPSIYSSMTGSSTINHE